MVERYRIYFEFLFDDLDTRLRCVLRFHRIGYRLAGKYAIYNFI